MHSRFVFYCTSKKGQVCDPDRSGTPCNADTLPTTNALEKEEQYQAQEAHDVLTLGRTMH
jgi:hypothetical protein